MSNIFTGNPYAITKQAIVGTTPIVGLVTQVGNNRIISYALLTDGTVDGAWKIEASNDFALDMDVSMGNNPAATWFDVTAAFTVPGGGAIAAVVHGTASTQKQIATCAPCAYRVTRPTFTPSAGAGNAQAAGAGGSY